MNCVLQPLVHAHNGEIVYIEKNDQTTLKKFSRFKIFKLKGPIDIDFLLNILFPPSERNHYDLEISEYNGRSTKVKFSFTNKTHNDLIKHLQNAAAKVYDLSENGLADWFASDTITFKTIYQNIDTTAIQQLQDTDASNDSSSDLYPIIDEEAFERELKELSERISSQTSSNYYLEKMFQRTYKRRDITITIPSLVNELFGQIKELVALKHETHKVTHENYMLNSKYIINRSCELLCELAEARLSKVQVTAGSTHKYLIILTLLNLINVLRSIGLSYQVLLETDEALKQIFQSQKDDFMSLLSIVDKSLMDLLIILNDEIDREKYEKLLKRLANFVVATKDLMTIVMIVNNECDEQIKKLENQENGLTKKLIVGAFVFGVTAIATGGYLKYSKNNKIVVRAAAVVGGLGGTAILIKGYLTRLKLQDSIEKQTRMLNELKKIHFKLSQWQKLGEAYIERDINDMNNSRITLIDEFVKIRIQCKHLRDIFDF